MGKAGEFLKKHGMEPERIDICKCAGEMREDMERGLAGQQSDMPMIPAYVIADGLIPEGEPAVIIDAGGTNFRCGLVRFEKGGYTVENLVKKKMPGIEKSASWEEFISFVADAVLPMLDKTDRIGFCFSYTAVITPEIDGKVVRIDKEVVIRGAEEQLVGASLIRELERRGVKGKRVVLINDTVAVLLGGRAMLNGDTYSGFAGQVSGTGENTCCTLPLSAIGKLGMQGDGSMTVNIESGLYGGMPRGDFDRLLDEQSNNPGSKHLEKMTAGAYLGELCRLCLLGAAEEGWLSASCAEKLRGMEQLGTSRAEAWSVGEELEEFPAEDGAFIRELCEAIFIRAARCLCADLSAVTLLTDAGGEKPFCVCAEGSLIQHGRVFRSTLLDCLEKYTLRQLGRKAELKIVEESTIPGAAAAALMNI